MRVGEWERKGEMEGRDKKQLESQREERLMEGEDDICATRKG